MPLTTPCIGLKLRLKSDPSINIASRADLQNINDQFIFLDLIDDANRVCPVGIAAFPFSLKSLGGDAEGIMREFIKKTGEFF